jgi:hypothetical protein
MTTKPVIVHLIGFPAAGKLTIARAIAGMAERQGSHFVVVDNHHTSNVIFAVLDVDGIRELPPEVWDRVREVRNVVMRSIEELSPRDWSFIFTNVLTERDPTDRAVVDGLAQLAAKRSSHYVPVRLHCDTEVLLGRVDNADRRERLKSIDPVGVRALIDSTRLIDVRPHTALDLDVTNLSPTDAAARILDHVNTFH